MISIWVVIGILLSHYICDFLLQTEWMALGKSGSLLPLSSHIAVYTISMTILALFYIPTGHIIAWMFLNGLTHFGIDYITSRTGKWCRENDKRTLFFWNLGFDQFLHYLILFLTYNLFF